MTSAQCQIETLLIWTHMCDCSMMVVISIQTGCNLRREFTTQFASFSCKNYNIVFFTQVVHKISKKLQKKEHDH